MRIFKEKIKKRIDFTWNWCKFFPIKFSSKFYLSFSWASSFSSLNGVMPRHKTIEITTIWFVTSKEKIFMFSKIPLNFAFVSRNCSITKKKNTKKHCNLNVFANETYTWNGLLLIESEISVFSLCFFVASNVNKNVCVYATVWVVSVGEFVLNWCVDASAVFIPLAFVSANHITPCMTLVCSTTCNPSFRLFRTHTNY